MIEIGIPSTSKNALRSTTNSKPVLGSGENDLIYDFYGFPPQHYKTQFHTKNDFSLASDIVQTLKAGGLKAKLTQRGLDHGAWVPLRVSFGNTSVADTGMLDIDVPLIPVSLTASSSMDVHYKLDQILSKYRGLNGVVIGSGMSVHNLRDIGKAAPLGSGALPYVAPFNRILTSVLTDSSASGKETLERLHQIETNSTWKRLYTMSHPTNEHFMPVVVGAGASLGDSCKELYSAASLSLGWNIYRWG